MGTFWLEGMSGSLRWCSATHTGSGLGWGVSCCVALFVDFQWASGGQSKFLAVTAVVDVSWPLPSGVYISYSFHTLHQTLNRLWLETLDQVDVFRVVYEVICAPPLISHLKVHTIHAVPQRVWLKHWSACKSYVCTGHLISVPSLYYYTMVMCDACWAPLSHVHPAHVHERESQKPKMNETLSNSYVVLEICSGSKIRDFQYQEN